MNVTTISVSQDEAVQKLQEYKAILKEQRKPEDLALQRAFRMAKKYRLINVAAVFKETGLNDLGQPRLAIAQADWETVMFWSRTFTNDRWARGKTHNITIPADCLDTEIWANKRLMTPVPHIPPQYRPKFKLSNYHILFEVENWQEYPVDPFLLKRVHGWIFAIIAEWDLTPLEQQILTGFNQT